MPTPSRGPHQGDRIVKSLTRDDLRDEVLRRLSKEQTPSKELWDTTASKVFDERLEDARKFYSRLPETKRLTFIGTLAAGVLPGAGPATDHDLQRLSVIVGVDGGGLDACHLGSHAKRCFDVLLATVRAGSGAQYLEVLHRLLKFADEVDLHKLNDAVAAGLKTIFTVRPAAVARKLLSDFVSTEAVSDCFPGVMKDEGIRKLAENFVLRQLVAGEELDQIRAVAGQAGVGEFLHSQRFQVRTREQIAARLVLLGASEVPARESLELVVDISRLIRLLKWRDPSVSSIDKETASFIDGTSGAAKRAVVGILRRGAVSSYDEAHVVSGLTDLIGVFGAHSGWTDKQSLKAWRGYVAGLEKLPIHPSDKFRAVWLPLRQLEPNARAVWFRAVSTSYARIVDEVRDRELEGYAPDRLVVRWRAQVRSGNPLFSKRSPTAVSRVRQTLAKIAGSGESLEGLLTELDSNLKTLQADTGWRRYRSRYAVNRVCIALEHVLSPMSDTQSALVELADEVTNQDFHTAMERSSVFDLMMAADRIRYANYSFPRDKPSRDSDNSGKAYARWRMLRDWNDPNSDEATLAMLEEGSIERDSLNFDQLDRKRIGFERYLERNPEAPAKTELALALTCLAQATLGRRVVPQDFKELRSLATRSGEIFSKREEQVLFNNEFRTGPELDFERRAAIAAWSLALDAHRSMVELDEDEWRRRGGFKDGRIVTLHIGFSLAQALYRVDHVREAREVMREACATVFRVSESDFKGLSRWTVDRVYDRDEALNQLFDCGFMMISCTDELGDILKVLDLGVRIHREVLKTPELQISEDEQQQVVGYIRFLVLGVPILQSMRRKKDAVRRSRAALNIGERLINACPSQENKELLATIKAGLDSMLH